MKERQSLAISTHRARAVAEEDAGVAVGVVDHRRHLVGSDDDDALVASALYHRAGQVERVEESAAGRRRVHGEGVVHPQSPDDDGGRRGKLVVGSSRGDDKRVDGVGIGSRLLQQLACGLASHVARAQPLLGEDAPLLDADARLDPLIGGIDHARQLLVGEDVVGHVAADTGDDSVYLLHLCQ